MKYDYIANSGKTVSLDTLDTETKYWRLMWLLELELYGTIEPHEEAELAIIRQRSQGHDPA